MRLFSPWAACLLVGCSLVLRYERAPEGSDATCRGGADEDRDGLADCDDPDCELACIPRPIPPELLELACPPGWREDGADDVLGVRVPRCAAPARTCTVIEPDGVARIVDPDAVAGGDGTEARPFASLAEAIASQSVGLQYVRLRPGIHTDSIAFDATSRVLTIYADCADAGAVVLRSADPAQPALDVSSTEDGYVLLANVAIEANPGVPAVRVRGGTLQLAFVDARAPDRFAEIEGPGVLGILDSRVSHTAPDAPEPLFQARIGALVVVQRSVVDASAFARAVSADLRVSESRVTGWTSIFGGSADATFEASVLVRAPIQVNGGAATIRASIAHESSVTVSGGEATLENAAFVWLEPLGADFRSNLLRAESRSGRGRLVARRVVLASVEDEGCAVELDGHDAVLEDVVVSSGGAAICSWADDPLTPAPRTVRRARIDAGRFGVFVGTGVATLVDVDVAGGGACNATWCGAGLEVRESARLSIERVRVRGSERCALELAEGGSILEGEGIALLERSRVGICVPSRDVFDDVLDRVGFIDAQADVRVADEEACAPRRSRGCGVPFDAAP